PDVDVPSLHDALPIWWGRVSDPSGRVGDPPPHVKEEGYEQRSCYSLSRRSSPPVPWTQTARRRRHRTIERRRAFRHPRSRGEFRDRKSTRLNSSHQII